MSGTSVSPTQVQEHERPNLSDPYSAERERRSQQAIARLVERRQVPRGRAALGTSIVPSVAGPLKTLKLRQLQVKLRKKHDDPTSGYSYAAKELFVDATGDPPSLLANWTHLQQEAVRVEQARDILVAFMERCKALQVVAYREKILPARFKMLTANLLALEIAPSTLYKVAIPPEVGRAWLVEPFLGTDPPVKFSGTDVAGQHGVSDRAGCTVDAFAHFSHLQSMGTLVLVDLQGIYRRNPFAGLPTKMPVVLFDIQTHTMSGDSGLGDAGPEGIEQFHAQHQCNDICRHLGFEGLRTFADEAVRRPYGSMGTSPQRYKDADGLVTEVNAMDIEDPRILDAPPAPVQILVTGAGMSIQEADPCEPPPLHDIRIFALPDQVWYAPAEVLSIDTGGSQVELKWCDFIKWGTTPTPHPITFKASFSECEKAHWHEITAKTKLMKICYPGSVTSDPPTSPLRDRLNAWTSECASILCGIRPHKVMDDWVAATHSADHGRTRYHKLATNFEFVKSHQAAMEEHEEDVLSDWIGEAVLTECRRLNKELVDSDWIDLSGGPGLVLGSMAVALCLLEEAPGWLNLSNIYDLRDRLERGLRPTVIRAWEAMQRVYRPPVGSQAEARNVVLELDGESVWAGIHTPGTTAYVRVMVPAPGLTTVTFSTTNCANEPTAVEWLRVPLMGSSIFAGVYRPGKTVIVEVEVLEAGPIWVMFVVIEEEDGFPLLGPMVYAAPWDPPKIGQSNGRKRKRGRLAGEVGGGRALLAEGVKEWSRNVVVSLVGRSVWAGVYSPGTTAYARVMVPHSGKTTLTFTTTRGDGLPASGVLLKVPLTGRSVFAGVYRPGSTVIVEVDVLEAGMIWIVFGVVGEGDIFPVLGEYLA
ncbi:hypothetical protein CALCODRAFT_480929 [Calocera cornea HHB12733]|uniref:Alpha-type protein kinase domain-containing protein n=1 Tax=Calocera cornea HHB12733 TaxID=1353952 RepID=A0A165I712_9BASI|nr:hypothetical protein CALCODRAFT_480929 [Calocera cornea HHB12733]